jgi:hypothetical protein
MNQKVRLDTAGAVPCWRELDTLEMDLLTHAANFASF